MSVHSGGGPEGVRPRDLLQRRLARLRGHDRLHELPAPDAVHAARRRRVRELLGVRKRPKRSAQRRVDLTRDGIAPAARRRRAQHRALDSALGGQTRARQHAHTRRGIVERQQRRGQAAEGSRDVRELGCRRLEGRRVHHHRDHCGPPLLHAAVGAGRRPLVLRPRVARAAAFDAAPHSAAAHHSNDATDDYKDDHHCNHHCHHYCHHHNAGDDDPIARSTAELRAPEWSRRNPRAQDRSRLVRAVQNAGRPLLPRELRYESHNAI